MYSWLLLLLLWAGGGEDLLRQAQQAQRKGNYQGAINLYQQALPQLPLQADEIRFNMAQCWFALDSIQRAEPTYRQVASRLSTVAQAAALTNLGILQAKRKQVQEGLSSFKQALVLNPGNEAARYNYELLLRLNPPPPPEKNPPPPPPSKVPPPPLASPRPTENTGGKRQSTVSPAEAELLLKQLSTTEKLYLQQQRKRLKGRPAYQDTPDW